MTNYHRADERLSAPGRYISRGRRWSACRAVMAQQSGPLKPPRPLWLPSGACNTRGGVCQTGAAVTAGRRPSPPLRSGDHQRPPPPPQRRPSATATASAAETISDRHRLCSGDHQRPPPPPQRRPSATATASAAIHPSQPPQLPQPSLLEALLKRAYSGVSCSSTFIATSPTPAAV